MASQDLSMQRTASATFASFLPNVKYQSYLFVYNARLKLSFQSCIAQHKLEEVRFAPFIPLNLSRTPVTPAEIEHLH